LKIGVDICSPIGYNVNMKTKTIIIIILCLLFNDFVGAIVSQFGILINKIGGLISRLPQSI